MADDELWHVRMSPDDVKQLTLEQLDDLFRLEVIEADTLIWQPGMTEWLPLSVVAGLGDEDPAAVNIPVSEAPPAPMNRMAQTQTAWPPRAIPQTTTPPPPSMRSAPPSNRSAPPHATTASSWPPPAAWSNPPPRAQPAPPPAGWSNPPPRPQPVSAFASTVATEPPRAPKPPSVAPQSFGPDPFAPVVAPASFSTAPALRGPRRSETGGSWLIVLALAAGAAVTLYRNDLVHAAAHSVGQEGTYLKLETALGGPSFGTPRAVEQMAAAAQAITSASAPAEASTTSPISTAAPASTSTADTTASQPSTASPGPTAAATATATTAAPESAPSPEKAAAAKAPAAPPKATAPASHAISHSAASPAPTVDSVFKTPKKGKKASEYDPLNPSL